jgi:outer membrane protein OmpA-like peptidoglycan-associated protein
MKLYFLIKKIFLMKKWLFAMTTAALVFATSCKTSKSAQQQQADADDIVATLRKNVPNIDITEMGNKVKIVLGESVYFNIGSAALTPSASTSLDQMAAVLRKYDRTRIHLDGYTDNTGTIEINQKLSLDRAVSVKNYLQTKGIDPSRVRTFGHADSNPIADNSTVEGRARNRRVEFLISYEK